MRFLKKKIKLKPLHFEIDEKLKQRLKNRAKEEGVTVSTLIRFLIEEELEKPLRRLIFIEEEADAIKS